VTWLLLAATAPAVNTSVPTSPEKFDRVAVAGAALASPRNRKSR
jgi:hypothetical protein